MSLGHGASIVRNGLVFHVDTANPKIGTKNYANGSFSGNSNIPTITVTDTLPDGSTGTVYEHNAILQGDNNRTARINLSNGLMRGKTYTLSFYAKNISATGFFGNVYDSTLGRVIKSISSYASQINSSTWSRISITFTIPNEGSLIHSLDIQYFRDAGVGVWRVVWPQVEEGSISTVYSPRFNNVKLLSNINTSLSLVSGAAYIEDSILYDGTNDYAILPSFSSSNISENFTFSVWVYFFNLPTANPRFLQFSTGIDDIWSLAAYGGSNPSAFSWFWIERKKSGVFYGSAGTSLTYEISKWYNVIGTFDTSTNTPRLYVNGSLIPNGGGIAGGGAPTNNDLYVGSTQLNGLLSNIQIYNRSLSVVEVQQNFEASRGRYGI
jgi:hypothetical protein